MSAVGNTIWWWRITSPRAKSSELRRGSSRQSGGAAGPSSAAGVEAEVQGAGGHVRWRQGSVGQSANCSPRQSVSTFLHHTEPATDHFLPQICSSSKRESQCVFLRGMTDQCLIREPLIEMVTKTFEHKKQSTQVKTTGSGKESTLWPEMFCVICRCQKVIRLQWDVSLRRTVEPEDPVTVNPAPCSDFSGSTCFSWSICVCEGIAPSSACPLLNFVQT